MSLCTNLLSRTLATNGADPISRRTLLLAPIFASLPFALGLSTAEASIIDPAETAVTLPDAGIAPVNLKLVDPSKPAWRRV